MQEDVEEDDELEEDEKEEAEDGEVYDEISVEMEEEMVNNGDFDLPRISLQVEDEEDEKDNDEDEQGDMVGELSEPALPGTPAAVSPNPICKL